MSFRCVESEQTHKQHKEKSWNFLKSRIMKTLLLVLTFSGLSVLSVNIKEYHYVKSSKTWTEAQSYCREMFSDLATVDNQDDNDRLLSVIQGSEEYAWIGLHDDLNRWKWALGNEDFDNKVAFAKWDTNQPNLVNLQQTCVKKKFNDFWNDLSCESKIPAVCFYDKGPPVYILVTADMTWHEARNYCKSNYTDLASARNESEHNAIVSLLSGERAWIGLHRFPWPRWSDQTPTTFTNWNLGQPDGSGYTMTSCAAVSTATGTWQDDDCEEKRYFICQYYQRKRTTLRLKFQSEADLSDPDIQQQLLEELHAKLESHGLSDFKLHWTQADGQNFNKEPKSKAKPQGSER